MFKSSLVVAWLAATALAESACEGPGEVTITTSYTYSDITATYVTITPTDYVTMSTETPTVYSTTVTETETVEPNGVYECSSTTTKSVDYTSTVYSGSYSSSSLRPLTSCAPVTHTVRIYPGTESRTYTSTEYYPTVTANSTVTTASTDYIYVTSGEPWTTIKVDCTSTILETTGTASSAVTQAAKCAPTNLIGTDGKPGQRWRGAPLDGIANYGSGDGGAADEEAHKDASACCQACQDDENCAASIFVGGPATYENPKADGTPFCQLYNQNPQSNNESCGLGFSVFPGDKQVAQSGSCGYVAQIVYAPGTCFEGDTVRECASYAGYRRP
ncbi:hypothetical protein Q7P37_001389 [Cladosporium fusiforme]